MTEPLPDKRVIACNYAEGTSSVAPGAHTHTWRGLLAGSLPVHYDGTRVLVFSERCPCGLWRERIRHFPFNASPCDVFERTFSTAESHLLDEALHQIRAGKTLLYPDEGGIPAPKTDEAPPQEPTQKG